MVRETNVSFAKSSHYLRSSLPHSKMPAENMGPLNFGAKYCTKVESHVPAVEWESPMRAVLLRRMITNIRRKGECVRNIVVKTICVQTVRIRCNRHIYSNQQELHVFLALGDDIT